MGDRSFDGFEAHWNCDNDHSDRISTLALRHDSFVSWLIRAATDEEGVKDVA